MPRHLFQKSIVGLLAINTLFVWFLVKLPGNAAEVHFLDIGQGDAILIRTPQYHNILIDGGPPGSQLIQKMGKILPPLERTIDLMILTHPHLDHIGGLMEVLERYKVKNVLLTGVQHKSSYYENFLSQMKNAKIHIADEKKDFILGEIFLDTIYPFTSIANDAFQNINNSSIVIKMTFKKTNVLFTGDAEQEVEEKILAKNTHIQAEIMKAAHHGSRTSNTSSYLDAIQPVMAIIQVGKGNKYDHPHQETLEKFSQRKIKIWRNDLHGTVSIFLKPDGEEMIKTERSFSRKRNIADIFQSFL